jgi:hypothetical protein
MTLAKGRSVAGTSKQVKKGPVSVQQMKNGEEILQYHNGRLKIIRKEFGKLFELEFSSPELKELKTFAKHSDVKKPQKDAIKVIKDGVRVARGKNTYFAMPDSGDSSVEVGETEQSSTTGQFIIKE